MEKEKVRHPPRCCCSRVSTLLNLPTKTTSGHDNMFHMLGVVLWHHAVNVRTCNLIRRGELSRWKTPTRKKKAVSTDAEKNPAARNMVKSQTTTNTGLDLPPPHPAGHGNKARAIRMAFGGEGGFIYHTSTLSASFYRVLRHKSNKISKAELTPLSPILVAYFGLAIVTPKQQAHLVDHKGYPRVGHHTGDVRDCQSGLRPQRRSRSSEVWKAKLIEKKTSREKHVAHRYSQTVCLHA